MKTTKEKIEVMQAFDRGETIEYQGKGVDRWETCMVPVWDWYSGDYRVKPKTTTLYWAVFASQETGTPFSCSTSYTLAAYEKLKKEYEDAGYVVLREYIDEFSH